MPGRCRWRRPRSCPPRRPVLARHHRLPGPGAGDARPGKEEELAMTRLRLAGLSALAADGLATLVAFSRLSERVPVHWNFRGEIDRMGSRLELALLGPILIAVIWGVFE